NDGNKEDIPIYKCDNNMYYEVEELIRLIQTKSNAQKHNQCSLMQLSIMDEVRKLMGITFPADVKMED
ncbi:MAG: dehydrogenase, partial [Firmicutes bacterium]|nr:dehydrogenase [Bacillota bacterium]